MGEQIIDKLFPDPTAKAQAIQDYLLLQQQGELKELETRMSAILAEANSSDPWTSRARPTFMYLFYLVLLILVIIAPFVGIFHPDAMTQFYTNVSLGFKAIPEAMWWTFTTGFLGYAGARTYEKTKGVAK
ncbi:MAG: hypothetical protein COA83_09695 [Methylophaga sp.]|nr:MAG: hypothetical protein COA83_09695 [Methylophaga sp.]